MHHLSSYSLRPDDLYKPLMWLLAQNKLLDALIQGLSRMLWFISEILHRVNSSKVCNICVCVSVAPAEGGWFYSSTNAGREGNETQWRHAAEEKEQEVGNTLKSERAGRAGGEGQCVCGGGV